MTQFLAPLDQRFAAELADMRRRLATLDQQMTRTFGTCVAVVCTSTTRPATPAIGCVVFETDTSKLGVWNGSAWVRTAALT